MHEYSEKVLDHFYNPRNLGTLPENDPKVGVGKVGNPVCGDVMKLYIKVVSNESGVETIEEAKFQTLGCGAAIATSSIATELLKGKLLAEAVELSNQAIEEALEGLPPVKKHCSNLAAEAVRSAVENYRKNRV